MVQEKDFDLVENPCGSFGPDQWYAVVWFVLMIVGGGALTAVLASIDRHMYDTNAETLDYQTYAENRTAHTTLPNDSFDPRSFGGLATARNRLARSIAESGSEQPQSAAAEQGAAGAAVEAVTEEPAIDPASDPAAETAARSEDQAQTDQAQTDQAGPTAEDSAAAGSSAAANEAASAEAQSSGETDAAAPATDEAAGESAEPASERAEDAAAPAAE